MHTYQLAQLSQDVRRIAAIYMAIIAYYFLMRQGECTGLPLPNINERPLFWLMISSFGLVTMGLTSYNAPSQSSSWRIHPFNVCHYYWPLSQGSPPFLPVCACAHCLTYLCQCNALPTTSLNGTITHNQRWHFIIRSNISTALGASNDPTVALPTYLVVPAREATR